MIKTLASMATYVAAYGNTIDSSTYANIEEVEPMHISLDFAVDFDRKIFDGNVIHTMRSSVANLTTLFFDAAGIEVSKVEYMNIKYKFW